MSHSKIEIIKADTTTLVVDAVVNAANSCYVSRECTMVRKISQSRGIGRNRFTN